MSTSHRRPIRSYVRREGRITRAQRRALEELAALYVLDVSRPLNFQTIFGRRAPVAMEIGFGNGEALVAMAARAPETDFVGVEVYRPGIGSALLKIHALELANVRIAMGDAAQVLADAVPPNSLCRLLIFFPDPWPKKRHHKRRLVQPSFLDIAVPRLAPGGQLHLATDWPDYADQMLSVLTAHPGLDNVSPDGGFAERPAYRPVSRYERRGHALGHRVRDLVFERRPQTSAVC